MGLAKMNEGPKNHGEHVGEEQKEWEVEVQWEARLHPQPNQNMKLAEPETVHLGQQMFVCRHLQETVERFG